MASNPLSPTNSEKPAHGLAFCYLEFNEDEHCRPDKRSAIRQDRSPTFGNAGWRRKRLIRPTAQHCRPDKRSAIRRARLLIFGNAGWRRRRLIRPTAQHCRPDKRSAIRRARLLIFGNAGWRRRRLIRPTAISPLAKNVHHFSLFVHVFVTYSIVFFYLCLNFFLRYLWLSPAFSAVRFSVRDINRSDMQHFVRNFSQSAQTLITKCCEI